MHNSKGTDFSRDVLIAKFSNFEDPFIMAIRIKIKDVVSKCPLGCVEANWMYIWPRE